MNKKGFILGIIITLIIVLGHFYLKENVTMQDLYGDYFDEYLENESEYTRAYQLNLLLLNFHRKDKGDLKRMLRPYFYTYIRTFPNLDYYEFRRDIRYYDPYFEKARIPKSKFRFNQKSKMILEALENHQYQLIYTYSPSMSDYAAKKVVIEADGSYQLIIERFYEEDQVEKTGQFSTEAINDVLKLAVSIGFFELIEDIGDDNIFDGSGESIELIISEQSYKIGGYEREGIDDIFFKVNGALKKIIEEEVTIK